MRLQQLLSALEAVLEGRTYLAPTLTGDVLALMAGPAEPSAIELSSRQKEVLCLIVNGRRMKEIAAGLDLSPRTVETLKYDMMRTLNIHSTAELIRYAIEHHLVSF